MSPVIDSSVFFFSFFFNCHLLSNGLVFKISSICEECARIGHVYFIQQAIYGNWPKNKTTIYMCRFAHLLYIVFRSVSIIGIRHFYPRYVQPRSQYNCGGISNNCFDSFVIGSPKSFTMLRETS